MKVSKLLVGLFAGALSLAVYAQQPIVIKFSHVWPTTRLKAKPPRCLPKRLPS